MPHSPTALSFDLLVVGAGAAGLMGAWQAAQQGLRVALLDHQARVGQKLALAGGGRCNFTHHMERGDLEQAFHSKEAARFLNPAFSAMSPTNLRTLFHAHGLPSFVDENGRVFPKSEKASDLVHLFFQQVKQSGVKLFLQQSITSIESLTCTTTENAQFQIHIDGQSRRLLSRSILLCTGGLAYPHTGSDGSGLTLAQSLGHSTIPFRAALAPLNLPNFPFSSLSGLSLSNLALRFVPADDPKAKTILYRGDLLFTHRGYSGPLALNVSRYLPLARLELSFFPDEHIDSLEAKVLAALEAKPNLSLKRFFEGYFPKPLVQALGEAMQDIDPQLFSKTKSTLSKRHRRQLLERLLAFPLALPKAVKAQSAMLSRGGIPLNEVNKKTLESKRCKGLYFAGELLDVDGCSGGYNLQAAFSTAYLAAQSIADTINQKR